MSIMSFPFYGATTDTWYQVKNMDDCFEMIEWHLKECEQNEYFTNENCDFIISGCIRMIQNAEEFFSKQIRKAAK